MYVRSVHPLTGRRRRSLWREVDLVGPVDRQTALQIGVGLVAWRRRAGFRTLIDRYQAHVVRAGGTITVFMNGERFSWTVPNPLAGDTEIIATDDRLIAPMPGLIKAIAVDPGDQMVKGALVLVMEAMKMEHSLKMPCDGIISDVFVAIGDQVEEGKILVELDASVDKLT